MEHLSQNNIDKDWVDEFMAIPEEYRVNPFDMHPDGDLFFADKRNIEELERGLKDVEEGRVTRIKSEEELISFLDSL
jgi:hypothetical protein